MSRAITPNSQGVREKLKKLYYPLVFMAITNDIEDAPLLKQLLANRATRTSATASRVFNNHYKKQVRGGELFNIAIKKTELILYHFVCERELDDYISSHVTSDSSVKKKIKKLLLKTANFYGKIEFAREELRLDTPLVTKLKDLNQWRNDILHNNTLTNEAQEKMYSHFWAIVTRLNTPPATDQHTRATHNPKHYK
ncbi:hypothetical protein A3K24_02055 [candidate division Kazan bacterium RIFCSPHIGHO2_01_FULL_44_14]|uniref:Uncharacterized protein n=1 Tax=candidate division Kazan bacterium RIFCSPLOWO2_01_FULL_45_19 TaxID=1798538 RepID=A0A1F4NQ74_UNCK3|nr:hypothetical protein [uncultured bacterium]AQS31029.1 hypothetical protein [uncultured bacterium]OGB73609.1 MAG: hypothetical protein A3K51_02055 [candidate division Kazan bacterium RIFCSPLOWO2_01_FULL_45_19]OGB77854.1 MAG: hypothetical protein A3K24_02055 [candidate division Kazan bacterium RIFCSPHIGHO2_01_FULL_44_14]